MTIWLFLNSTERTPDKNSQVHVVHWPSNNLLSSQPVMQSLVCIAVKSAMRNEMLVVLNMDL